MADPRTIQVGLRTTFQKRELKTLGAGRESIQPFFLLPVFCGEQPMEPVGFPILGLGESTKVSKTP
jgi:hypothetical protein